MKKKIEIGFSDGEAHAKEQLVWSEEDVAYIDELTEFFEHCGELRQPQENVVKWLQSLKERIGCAINFTAK